MKTNPGMQNAAISINGVSKRFGQTNAVSDLTFDVPQGSLMGFLGPNGAGKSTTIRMIMSIIYPDAGQIEVLNESALSAKLRIGYLPEERGLYRKMKVVEFLTYIAKLKGMKARDLPSLIDHWLKRVELPDVANQRCETLSKGMQQKIQFLAAVMHEPDLLILDEPFSGLDPVSMVLLRDLITDFHEQGRTILFSTHVLHQAEQICDRIILINHGATLLEGTLDQINARFDPRTIEARPKNIHADLASIQDVRETNLSQNGSVEVHLNSQADPYDVLQRIVAEHPMHSIGLRRPSLEEIFVDQVRNDQGQEAAAHARAGFAQNEVGSIMEHTP